MDFFGAQDDALRRSRRLVLLFGAAVVSMIAVVYLVTLVAFGMGGVSLGGGMAGGWLHPELLGGVALGMGALIGGGSAVRTAQLRKGGGAVARLLGGRPLDLNSTNAADRRLRNVVEEMAIASGVPVPEIYVLEGESGINAFAAGNSIHDAAVAVTRGTLDQLDRDELQGVVAHEFSHILNGDMRLNVRLIGVLFGILLLTVVGRGILRTSGGRRSGKGGGQIALLGLVLVLLGYLGVFFGRMIQSAVSRQREFLADASAVQFTRNPAGIAGALRKIGGDSGSRIANHHADEVGHLFFANGIRGALSQIFATHPPLEERIRRIEPGSGGAVGSPVTRRGTDTPGAAGAPLGKGTASGGRPGFPGRGSGAGLPGPAGLPLPLPGVGVLGMVGNPTLGGLAGAHAFLEDLPGALREAARTAEGASTLLYALLLGADPAVRARQFEALRERIGGGTAERAGGLHPVVAGVGPAARLPLLDLALPALRSLSKVEGQTLYSAALLLVRADARIDPFEYALLHTLRRNLALHLEARGGAPTPRSLTLDRARPAAETLLTALARSGAREEAAAERAFADGAARLFSTPSGGWRLGESGTAGIEEVDRALDRLQALAPWELKRLLEAALATIESDRRLEVEELELFRAVCEALDAPVPPPFAAADPAPRPDTES